MKKEESLSFLQSCIDKIALATEEDIKRYQEIYEEECSIPLVSDDFEFLYPSTYSKSQAIEPMLIKSDNRRDLKGYYLLVKNVSNQQNNDNLVFAA